MFFRIEMNSKTLLTSLLPTLKHAFRVLFLRMWV